MVELVREHDRCWSALDPVRLAGLWDEEHGAPVYLADEYLLPLVGWPDLERHWRRIGSRIERASVDSRVVLVSFLDRDLASVTCLSSWSVRTVEAPDIRSGRAWLTMLARRRPVGWKLVQYVETPIYAGQDFDAPPLRVSFLDGPATSP